MSHSLANDLPDKFGSSDEDDDDEEVVGWMGEARNHDNEDVDDDDDDDEDDDDDDGVREFGRRGLFGDRWEGGLQDDEDEFGFRGLGAGRAPPVHDVNVVKYFELNSSVELG